MRHIIKRLLDGPSLPDKQNEELEFWKQELKNYADWYAGILPELYAVKSPTKSQKVVVKDAKDSAILTWLEMHQKVKYAKDLQISPTTLKGKKVLDVGAGPMPSATVFQGIELYCLDPLYGQYVSSGFPLHYYHQTHFINAPSEDIPMEDNFFDVIISVNAIDHVDDFHDTAQELKRVLKPGGKFAMHVHYHKATAAEPIEITDKIFRNEYGWVKGLKKVDASTQKTGSQADEGEIYVLWKNF